MNNPSFLKNKWIIAAGAIILLIIISGVKIFRSATPDITDPNDIFTTAFKSGFPDTFTVDVPLGWSPVETRKDSLLMIGPQDNFNYPPAISIDAYSKGSSNFSSASDFINYYAKASPVRELVSKVTEVDVNGFRASRFETKETVPPAGDSSLKGPPAPGPIKNVYVVIPTQYDFWVIRYDNGVEDFDHQLPVFERVLHSFNIPLQPEKIALRIAWEAVMKIDRYKYWKAKGVEYKATAHPSYAKDSPKYKPELWDVDFDFPSGPLDQGIHVMINTHRGIILSITEDQA